MKGFTLVELLVVIAIASILSLVSYESIIKFQYQSVVESTATEFMSTVKTAQANSRDGVLPKGKTYADYLEDKFPTYGVSLSATNYTLVQHDTLADSTVENITLETHTFDSKITFTPTTYSVMFTRVTGLPDVVGTINIKRGSATTARNIKISDNGLIAYQ